MSDGTEQRRSVYDEDANEAAQPYVQLHQDPDVFQIPVPLVGSSLGFINVYVVRGKNSALVIDTGFNSRKGRKIILNALDDLGIDLNQTSLFITHFHSDHSGLFHKLLPKGRPCYMSQIDKDRFFDFTGERYLAYLDMLAAEGFPQGEQEKLMQDFMGGVGDPDALERVTCVSEDDTIYVDDYAFKPVWTPGHTPGHLCLYQPDQQLIFLGDSVLFDISPNISYAPGEAPMLESFVNSLAKLCELPIKEFFISHRGNKRGLSIEERADELMEHHIARLEDIMDVVNVHPEGVTAYEITRNIPWVARGKGFDDLEILQVFFAMTETMAHIEWLLDAGMLKREAASASALYFSTGLNCLA